MSTKFKHVFYLSLSILIVIGVVYAKSYIGYKGVREGNRVYLHIGNSGGDILPNDK